MQEETPRPSGPVISGLSPDIASPILQSELRRVFTKDEFCDAYRLSRSFYYRLGRAGQAPTEIRLGRKVVITPGRRSRVGRTDAYAGA
jgi:hypothetical protein